MYTKHCMFRMTFPHLVFRYVAWTNCFVELTRLVTDGLRTRFVAVWQGSSTREGAHDQRIYISQSADGTTWSRPVKVFSNWKYVQWGPVLHSDKTNSRLVLFFAQSQGCEGEEIHELDHKGGDILMTSATIRYYGARKSCGLLQLSARSTNWLRLWCD